MLDRSNMEKRTGDVFVALNGSIWLLVIGAFAIFFGHGRHLLTYLAAGVSFGGVVFLMWALIRAIARSFFASSRVDQQFLESMPSSKKLVGAGLIMIGWGSAGFVSLLFQ